MLSYGRRTGGVTNTGFDLTIRPGSKKKKLHLLWAEKTASDENRKTTNCLGDTRQDRTMAASKSPPFSGWFPAETHARERAMVMACPRTRTNPTHRARSNERSPRGPRPSTYERGARAGCRARRAGAGRPTNQPTTSPAAPARESDGAHTATRDRGKRLKARPVCPLPTRAHAHVEARDRMTATVTVSASIRGTCCRWRLKSELS